MNTEIQTQTFVHPFKYSFTTCFKERAIVDLMKPSVGAKVLEMGCGSAYFATVLRSAFPNSKFKYTGLDMSDDALSAARMHLPKSDDVLRGSVTEMPFEAASFDDVMYLDVIEHVDGDRKSLEEAFRVLKPGGRLLISTPNAGAPLTDTFFCEYMHDHGHMANERAGYTETELSTMLKDVGFTVSPARYTNVFLSELLITATKLGYRLLKPNYASQADVVEVSSSPLFALHKKVFFPFGYAIGRAEEMLLSHALKGHCMIILARKPS